jgi:pSer/pThr/pTyr-binding forkhead associated (FHA) protein
MARLVVLSEGFTGRTYELNLEKTTIGRLEENSFSIPESSISGHHCEILLRGKDIVVKDLDSTNGTFINGEKIKEAALKPSQILRLGQVEMRLESGTPGASAKPVERTMVIPQGVKFGEPDRSPPPPGPETAVFKKKKASQNRLFWVGVGVAAVVIVSFLVYALIKLNG